MKKSFSLAVATASAVTLNKGCGCTSGSDFDFNLGRRHKIQPGGRQVVQIRDVSPASGYLVRENKSNLGLDNALDARGFEVLGRVNVPQPAPATKTIVETELIPATREWQGLGSHQVEFPKKTLKMGGKRPEIQTTTTTEYLEPQLGTYEIVEAVSPTTRVIEYQPATQVIEVEQPPRRKQSVLQMPDLGFDFDFDLDNDLDLGKDMPVLDQRPILQEFLGYFEDMVTEVDFLQRTDNTFQFADLNSDGYLIKSEFRQYVQGFTEFIGIEFNEQMFQQEFKSSDKNCDGVISMREWNDHTYYQAKEKGMFIVSKIIDSYLDGVNTMDILVDGSRNNVWWLYHSSDMQTEPEFLQSVKNVFMNSDEDQDNKLNEMEAAKLVAGIHKNMGVEFDVNMFLGNFIDADHNDDGELTYNEFAVKAYNMAKDKGMRLITRFMDLYQEESQLIGSTQGGCI